MTDLGASTPAKPRRAASLFIWILVASLLTVPALSFGGFWVARSMDVDKPVLVGILVVTAVALEGAMWTTAAAVGLSVFETRKRIWRFLTGKGWTAA